MEINKKTILAVTSFIIALAIIIGCNISYKFGAIALIGLIVLCVCLILCGLTAVAVEIMMIIKDEINEKNSID